MSKFKGTVELELEWKSGERFMEGKDFNSLEHNASIKLEVHCNNSNHNGHTHDIYEYGDLKAKCK